METAFIINGNIRKLNNTINEINNIFKGSNYKIFTSEYAEHFTVLTQDAVKLNYKNFIFVGGDGTLNEGINALINCFKLDNDFDWEKIAQLKISIYPAGSGNDFIKTLYKDGISLEKIKTKINNNTTQLIDVGKANFVSPENKEATRFYINITDVGMGGDTVQRKEHIPKWLGANFSYMWAISSTLVQFKPLPMQVQYNNTNWSGKAMNFVVANGKYFGNGLCVAPEAELNDGIFEMVVIGNIGLLDYFKHLDKIKKGQKIIHPEVQYLKSNEVSITATSEKPLTIDMDGEFIGYAPLRLTCLKEKLCFLV